MNSVIQLLFSILRTISQNVQFDFSTEGSISKFLIEIACTVYPKKYAHGFVVLCFVVVMQSFIMNTLEVFIHIHQGCFAGTGAIVRLSQWQWSKPDGYRKISQCITTTKHSKAKTVCIFLVIYCSASSSTDVDVLKFRRVQYDKFYSGEQQEDASECLMLIELINKGSLPYCGSNYNNSTGVSLSEILFSFMLEKYIVCDAYGLRSSLIWV